MSWIAPHLLIKPGDVAKYVLLPGDPARAKRIAEFLDEATLKSVNREFVVYTGGYKGVEVSVTSTGIGGPSTAIAVEELARCGVKYFIRVGTCGALRKGIAVGDIIVPYGAVRLDGVTKRYVSPEYPAVTHPVIFNALTKVARELNINVITGIVVSDDMFYVGLSELKYWSSLNAVAIEMEASTIMVLASLKGLYGGAILVVDGNIIEGTGKADVGASGKSEVPQVVKEAIDKEIKVALEAVKYIAEKGCEEAEC